MTPFLRRIAQTFYSEYGNDLYRHTFVFPNKRAGVFFRKYLSEIAGKPLFSPRMITVQELFETLSEYRLADRTELLGLLYAQFRRLSKSEESFDDFLYWGDMLLNDFSDVDKHMVDAGQLFRNVTNLKSMEDDKSYLTEEQVGAIREFWQNFGEHAGNETKMEFLQIWEILFDLYVQFGRSLAEKGYAYEGMLFREVAQRAENGDELPLPGGKIIFVGLNAFTKSEIVLAEHLKNRGIADFYWDYASPLVRDEKNRASLWVKENLTRFPSGYELLPDEEPSQKPRMELISVPSAVGETKVVNRLLVELMRQNDISAPDMGLNTAIVLPDENLLIPTLYSIPSEINRINVTMGYPLQLSSVAGLVDTVAKLQRNVRDADKGGLFYHRFVISILGHPLVKTVAQEESERLIHYIKKHNRVMLTREELSENAFLQLIFTPITVWEQVPDYLRNILSEIYRELLVASQKESLGEKGGNVYTLEKEFIVQYYKSINRLQDTLSGVENVSGDTFFRLLKGIVSGVSVSFTGEPLSGLQVMGVLETRALDFDNLIILSMNEGVFPLRKTTNSFIPYTLRKGFGLPTYEYQDSVYAYHFYRLISRAKRIFMLYDARAQETQTGEVSRYFYQLKYLYSRYFDISEKVIGNDVASAEALPVSVAKEGAVLAKLNRFLAGGDRYLSASSVKDYINCPLQFYFSAVENLREEDEVQEIIQSDVVGTIFHYLMESLYSRYRGGVVTPDTLRELIEAEGYQTDLLETAFAKFYFKSPSQKQKLEGHHYLISEIIRDFVKQTLETDKQFAPFRYIESEHNFSVQYKASDTLSVNFKGKIDRIDKVGDVYRIVDYKSGGGNTDFSDFAELFDASKKERPYQILQVLIYSLFYRQENPCKRLLPAIYYLRKIFDAGNSPEVTFQKREIEDISGFLDQFTPYFDALLAEIFNPETPFSQTPYEHNCTYCDFRQICNR